jgi:hypothetical protein
LPYSTDTARSGGGGERCSASAPSIRPSGRWKGLNQCIC